jgi:hypothetical protein
LIAPTELTDDERRADSAECYAVAIAAMRGMLEPKAAQCDIVESVKIG